MSLKKPPQHKIDWHTATIWSWLEKAETSQSEISQAIIRISLLVATSICLLVGYVPSARADANGFVTTCYVNERIQNFCMGYVSAVAAITPSYGELGVCVPDGVGSDKVLMAVIPKLKAAIKLDPSFGKANAIVPVLAVMQVLYPCPSVPVSHICQPIAHMECDWPNEHLVCKESINDDPHWACEPLPDSKHGCTDNQHWDWEQKECRSYR